jgi:hypothetical protein
MPNFYESAATLGFEQANKPHGFVASAYPPRGLTRGLVNVRFGSKADMTLECALAGGQFSCGGFDSVPGVVILELCWA